MHWKHRFDRFCSPAFPLKQRNEEARDRVIAIDGGPPAPNNNAHNEAKLGGTYNFQGQRCLGDMVTTWLSHGELIFTGQEIGGHYVHHVEDKTTYDAPGSF